MTAYGAIFSARFRMLLQYRAAAIAGFGTRFFWGLIRIMIFDAFYRSTTAPQPMTFPQIVTYVWLGQAMLAMVLWGLDDDVRQMMRTGTVAYEWLRPLDIYTLWFCRSLASRAAPTLMQAVPVFLLAGLFFGMQAPPGWLSGAAWIVTTLGALLLCCSIATLLTITLLWTVSGEGLARFAPAFIYSMSGMLVPIPLFPAWARAILDFLPFRGMADVPYRVYIGHIPPEGVPGVLLHQLAWTALFVLIGRWLLARGKRRLVVQGG